MQSEPTENTIVAETTESENDKVVIVNMSDSSVVEQLSETILKHSVMIQGRKEDLVTDEAGNSIAKTITEDGSGIIIDISDQIYIVTNYHVVGQTEHVTVTFANQETATATMLGYDEFYDIAILTTPMKDSLSDVIQTATLGNSDTVKLGEMVIAVGNALGHGQSVTVGYISAIDREVAVSEGNHILLQTDAAINPGNSGGSLVNLNGELIGITASKYSEENVERMSFAIPVNDVLETISTIINKPLETTTNIGELGIYGYEIDEEYQELLQVSGGIYINRIQDISIAEQAGLALGDILIKVNDVDITSFADLHQALEVSENLNIVYLTNIDGIWTQKAINITFQE